MLTVSFFLIYHAREAIFFPMECLLGNTEQLTIQSNYILRTLLESNQIS